jgi:glycosyltransferase involved in cell wall biosynthesis
MLHERPLLSIVCPAYEEEDVLPDFHRALTDGLAPLITAYRIEILYVDDGSRDGTLEVLRALVAADGRVRYLSLSRNFGHQAALTAGMEHARGDAVVSLDTDLQHPPSLIPTLVARWREGHDVVLTLRAEDRRLGHFKRLTSGAFYRLLRRWSEVDVRAAASDFRLLSRKAVDGLLALQESHRYLRGMVQWLGFRVAEVPFRPDPRRAGASKYTVAKMTRLAADALFSFSRVPLRLSVGLGLGVTGISLLLCLMALIGRGGPVDWLPLCLVAAVHAVGASLLAAVGVLGEYVGRIYEECKRRPIYVLKDASPFPCYHTADDRPTPGPAGRQDRVSAA